MTTKELLKIQKYSDRILEIIEKQLRNDDNSLTQSDLQGAIDAIVWNIMHDLEK